jgi:hypothetical protein
LRPLRELSRKLVDASPSVEVLMYIFDGFRQGDRNGAAEVAVSTARVNTGYVTLREPFELAPGKYTAKVLLRIAETKSMGFVKRDFAVE